jgi:DNA-binding NarL/FixJ family response regulator
MATAAAQDRSDGQFGEATISLALIASSERLAWAALGALEHDGLLSEAHQLGSGPAAVERLPARTDVVLIMEDGPQLASVVHAVRRRAPDAGIVVVVAAATAGETRGLLAAGADALVLDIEREEVLATAMRSAALGQISIPRPLRECVELPALSHRERQILALVAAGCTNAQIGERLCLAESTIKTHLSSVFRRLGVKSRRQAAAALVSDDQVWRGVLGSVRPIDAQNGLAAWLGLGPARPTPP